MYSFFLDAVYGELHGYFDPNVWFDETELRKTIEQLAGCIILTGQEAPESNRKFKQDSYKKMMSGDKIAGRKPYGFTTRMLSLIGWKRIEANRMFDFHGVT